MIQDEEDYKRQFRELMERYGRYGIPHSEVFHIQEHLRAMYIIRSARERGVTNIGKELHDNDVVPTVIEQITGSIPTIDRRVKRADKHKGLEQWCVDRTGQIVKVDEIAAGAGVSGQKVRTFIDSRPDLFRRVERGRYEIKDMQAERLAAKIKDKDKQT